MGYKYSVIANSRENPYMKTEERFMVLIKLRDDEWRADYTAIHNRNDAWNRAALLAEDGMRNFEAFVADWELGTVFRVELVGAREEYEAQRAALRKAADEAVEALTRA